MLHFSQTSSSLHLLNKLVYKLSKHLFFYLGPSNLFIIFSVLPFFFFFFCALVCWMLEYGSIIWSPYQSCLVEKHEKVQRRFLPFIGFKQRQINILDDPTDNNLQIKLKLDSLSVRHRISDLSFLYKLVNGIITFLLILERISFHVPQYNSRSCPKFNENIHRTNYGKTAYLTDFLPLEINHCYWK